MVSVKLGAKVKNFDFDVADIRFKSLGEDPPKISIGRNEIKLTEDKNNYVVLEGEFKFKLGGDVQDMIRSLDSVTVVADGKEVYSASDLDLTAREIGEAFKVKDWLAEQDFVVRGNASGSQLTASGHKDVMHGLAGNDSLFGLAGNDKLFGDAGNDVLNGGEGNDFLTGGLGIDTFIFVSGDGADVVMDFTAKGRAHEIIDLTAVDSVASFEDLSLDQAGKNVVLDLGDGDTITLRNVALANLDASDFLF
ncbi:calcium-binding protein [Rhizobium sp. LjRoot254]|uniref:calcium-binding protein n=1 Tax=Rhizobium sp. LjRoot254 TaxID=3342297 RepID=UPI003ECE4217